MAKSKKPLAPNAERGRKAEKVRRRAAEENAKVDAKYVTPGSEAEKRMLERLEKEQAQAACDMTDFRKTGSEFIAQHDAQKNRNHDRLNNMWQRRMLLMVIGPLQNGLSGRSILQSVGMYVGLAAANPEMRRMVQKGASSVFDSLSKSFEQRNGADDKNAARFRELSETYMRKSNFGHLPFTAESAAVQHISMTKEAYAKMREGKLDPKSIMDDYGKSVETLRDICRRDGVDWNDVSQQERVLVGRMCREDPSQAMAFGDIMYDEVSPAKAHAERDIYYKEDGTAEYREQLVWTGEFEDADGNAFTGTFQPRTPLTVEKYSKEVADQFMRTMGQLQEDGMTRDDAHIAAFANLCGSIGYDFGDIKLSEASSPETRECANEHMRDAYDQWRRWRDMGKADGMTDYQVSASVFVGFTQASHTLTMRELYKDAKTEDDLWILKQGNGIGMMMSQYELTDKQREGVVDEYCDAFMQQRLDYEASQLGEGKTADDISPERQAAIADDVDFMRRAIMETNTNYRSAWAWRDADAPGATIDAVAEQEQRVCSDWVQKMSGNGKSYLRESCDEANRMCDPRKNEAMAAQLHELFTRHGGFRQDEGLGSYANEHIPKASVHDKAADEKRRHANQRDRARAAEMQFSTIFDNVEQDGEDYSR